MPRRVTAYECKYCHHLFKYEDKDLCEYHEGECLANPQNKDSSEDDDEIFPFFSSLEDVDNEIKT